VLAINLESAFFGAQLTAKPMIKQGSGGRILNISSVHEDWPMPGKTAYCLARGGVRAGSNSPVTTFSWSAWVRVGWQHRSISAR
jgi:NAD(P)-dependent dehydrogenase (short-subunit alcohol dehydrogenase family)